MTDRLTSKTFWIAALKRAAHTVAQTALGAIGAAAVIEAVDWLHVLSASALAGIISILKSIAVGVPETEPFIEYRTADENGVPTDGHIVTVKNTEE